MTEPGTDTARALWRVLEPIHGLVYFAPEAKAIYGDVGLKGFWMGYFASRAAPMGPVPAEVVLATFFNFAPSRVTRAIPDAWVLSTPAAATAARLQLADAALQRLLGDDLIASPEVAQAAAMARAAAEGCDPVGRPLFAGHAALPWPDEPHLVLWHAATLVREHRGDGHVAVLTSEGLSGIEANVLIAAEGRIPRPVLQESRDWTDDEWGAAEDGLLRRGLLWDDGQLSAEGRRLRERIEDATDRLAVGPWAHLGGDGSSRLRELARPLARAIVDAGAFPLPNPVGDADPR